MSGTDVTGKLHFADEALSILQGYEAAQIFDKMRRSDEQVIKVLSAIMNPIKTAEWRIDPASEDTKDLEAAALIHQILFEDIDWEKFLNECLTLIPHGYSMFEVVHGNFTTKDHGQYTGLVMLGFRRQSTITEWNHNRDTGELISIKQQSYSDISANVDIPAENLLLFFNQQEGDNIGFPLCRGLYGPYKRKLLATELQYIGIERFAIPTPIAKVPKNIKPGDAEYIAAQNTLDDFVSAENSYLLYPEGWEVNLQPNAGFDPSKIQIVIQAENEKMTGAILASFLELGVGGNSGAYALSNDSSDFFLSGIQYFANIIKGRINRTLIPQLMKMNYGDAVGVMPKLCYSGIADKAGKELMEVITGFAAQQIITKDEPLEDFVRSAYKLPKKAEGTIIENQESEDEVSPEPPEDPNSETPIEEPDDLVDEENVSLKLAEVVGHTHQGTGPAIQKGQKHYHELLDSSGNVSGRTQLESDTAGHSHVIAGDEKTGKPIKTMMEKELDSNPKKLIDADYPKISQILRDNLQLISSKYVNDILNQYKRLPEGSKLRAIQNVKVGGVNKLKKELKIAITDISRKALDQAKNEVPSKKDTKLSEKVNDIPGYENFKFNEFSSLPRRVQLLIANQVGLISDKEARDISDAIAFQFNSSAPSTNDIDVIKKDLEDKANEIINSGTTDTTAVNAASLAVNEARNSYLLDPEVSEAIASYTFINFDPKSAICKTLAGSTFAVNDPELVRYHPPLHHNCKSYLRANLKVNPGPDITGLPSISDEAKKSITLCEVQK